MTSWANGNIPQPISKAIPSTATVTRGPSCVRFKGKEKSRPISLAHLILRHGAGEVLMTFVRLVKSGEVASIAGVRLRANVIQAEGRETSCRGTRKHRTQVGSAWVCMTCLGLGKRNALRRYRSITLNTTRCMPHPRAVYNSGTRLHIGISAER